MFKQDLATPPNDAQSLTRDVQSCTDDLKTWMCNNQLKLNEDKTEAILLSTPSLSSCHWLLSLIMTRETVFSNKVRNLGFILNSDLTIKQHVIKICQTAYYELKCINSIRRYLTEDAAEQLVTSCVLHCVLIRLFQFSPHGHSRLCYSTDAESTNYGCARLIFRAPRLQNCTPLLQQLHWLPVSERIKHKTACMCYNVITGFASTYLSDLLHLYSPSHSLRSSSDTRMLKLHRFSRKTHGFRTFLTLRTPHMEQSPPRHQALCNSFPSKANSRHFSF